MIPRRTPDHDSAGRVEAVSALAIPLAKPSRIDEVGGIIADIGIHIHPVAVADRIGLHEPAEGGRVHPRLVVIEPDLGEPGLAGILEPARAARADAGIGSARNAPCVIAVELEIAAKAIAGQHDRAKPIRIELADRAVGDGGAVIGHQRIVA